jgi:hypothetical protein
VKVEGRPGPFFVDGTAKGWWRIGANYMEILLHRLDLLGRAFSRIDHFTDHWKGPDKPLVIDFTFEVGRAWAILVHVDGVPPSLASLLRRN